jgi:MFS family permease
MKRFRVPHIILALLCVMYFVTYADRTNISSAASEIQAEFGFSYTQLGLIFSVFGYPYLMFQIVGGWLGDKFGARTTLFWCGIVWGMATILTGLAGGILSLVLARLLVGAGEGATLPTATRAMQNWTAPAKRGFAQGITHSFARLGTASTPPLVALLMHYWGWRGSFFAMGAASLVWVIVWVVYFRNDSHSPTSRWALVFVSWSAFLASGAMCVSGISTVTVRLPSVQLLALIPKGANPSTLMLSSVTVTVPRLCADQSLTATM